MIVKYSTATIWWNNDVDFPSQNYINNFVNNMSTYTKNINYNGDGTISIFDNDFKINLIYVSLSEGGTEQVTYYKKINTIDNGNGIYEMVFEVDYWLTYMFKFLENANGQEFNFLRNSISDWHPLLNQEDPLLKDVEVKYNYIKKTEINGSLTNRYNFSFNSMNSADANNDPYTFCNSVTYYVIKQQGVLIALPVLSTNEVNIPYSYETGNRPTTTVFRGMKFNFTSNFNNGMSTNSYYVYNFENALKGLASSLGDNFVGKFFLPNLAYFNPKYIRTIHFTHSFQYMNTDDITYNSGNNPFTTISSHRIRYLGIVLTNKVYNISSQLLDQTAIISLPTQNLISTLPTKANETAFNQEYLRYSNFSLMNNKIPVEYLYNSTSPASTDIFIYAFVFNQGGYCKFNSINKEIEGVYNRYLSNFTNQEERTLFYGYQLPSETNAYLSWYNANKSQMETAKITQGLGFAMSSLFSVLGLVLSGSGIGAPIGLSMVAGGAMGAFSSVSGIAKTNANIADTKRQLQTNFAQSNISDFNFLSLWFWYSTSQTWASNQYNIWQIEKPSDQAVKKMNKTLYYFGYYQPTYLNFNFTASSKNFYYWQWKEDSGLKPFIIKSISYMSSTRDIIYNVAEWIYQKCLNGIRLWNVQPPNSSATSHRAPAVLKYSRFPEGFRPAPLCLSTHNILHLEPSSPPFLTNPKSRKTQRKSRIILQE